MDPVNETLRSRASASNRELTDAGDVVVTTLTTPGGIPASRASSPNTIVLKGASSAGLRTTVQPAAAAGATLRVAMASGTFHGVISRQQPTGPFTVTMCDRPSGAGAVRPPDRTPSSAYQRMKSAA